VVYDCFPFFNELELLEVRLHELDPVVDKFVLVEATRTFPGKPKPLHFAENRERFAAFADKIIHVVVEDMPAGDTRRDHWVRDRFQRNAIGRGLKECRPDDVILVSDLDEIPKVETLRRLIGELRYDESLFGSLAHRALNSAPAHLLFKAKWLRHRMRKIHPFIYRLEQYPCWYFLNRRVRAMEWWYGTKALFYRDFHLAEEVRHSGYKVIKDGGWHFSFMGDTDRILAKVAATAHQELNTPEGIKDILDSAALETIARELKDGSTELVPEEELPPYIRQHRERFASWLIDPAALPSC